jgi:hypothetical protein
VREHPSLRDPPDGVAELIAVERRLAAELAGVTADARATVEAAREAAAQAAARAAAELEEESARLRGEAAERLRAALAAESASAEARLGDWSGASDERLGALAAGAVAAVLHELTARGEQSGRSASDRGECR